MEEIMPDYHPIFKKGDKIKINDKDYLLNFQRTWKYHHNITDDQIKYAERLAAVKDVYIYHGGEVMYALKSIPGIWLEQLIEEFIIDGNKFVPASEYYNLKTERGEILVVSSEGETFRVKPEFGGIERSIKDMEAVAKLRSREGFERRYALSSMKQYLKKMWQYFR